MEGMTLTYTIIILMTVAIVNRIKAEAPILKDFWYTLMSIGIGAGLYAVSLYAPVVVQGFIFIGAAASGIFDVAKLVGSKINKSTINGAG